MKSSTANQRDIAGAIDIGGSKIACGLVTRAGELLTKMTLPTQPQAGAAQQITAALHGLKQMAETGGWRISGVGVGCTGPVDSATGTLGDIPFLPGWQGFALADYGRRQLQTPVYLENDADAALLGEVWWGNGRFPTNLILVTLGTGIGGGLFLNGQLYRGAGGTHPEIGHMVIVADGLACSCGGQGCWEAYCGGQGFAAWAQAAQQTPPAAPLSAQTIFRQAQQGSPHCQQWVTTFAQYLGVGLSNLITLYAPDEILLAGSLTQSSAQFLPMARQEAQRRCRLVDSQRVSIGLSRLGLDSGLLGAAAVFFNRDGV